MSEPTLTFKCLGHTKRDDGKVESYIIEVTDTWSQRIEVITIGTRELASARNMAQTLRGRNMFYRARQQEHDQTIRGMFESTPRPT
ncbi:hypothetical protein [Pseudomonas sp.]|uniref:hypothetical protein n=1 Tax=Pseudomonas sp. TaxID=306 RepID=UPI0028A05F1B|nr:hypothetical protein [Pseudomonas sp.]